MFKKVLVANRGEIAVRVLRACRELGLSTVAVYSDVDRSALHVRYADEAYPIGPAPAKESYLRIDRIIEVARKAKADAIHPGYGFLSENPEFARACHAAGFAFIGPRPETLQLIGNKVAARRLMISSGIPVIPGIDQDLGDEDIIAAAQRIRYPILVKAAASGGGKGMRIVKSTEELPSALASARREAEAAFGDGTLYLERVIEGVRHIEFQILADEHGNVIHLCEREGSIQRRHQKLIEEAPSPALDEKLHEEMGQVAVKAARACNYTNAGTVEFLLDRDANFYFLEINPRLQVEHPITEMVTGIDIVKEQLRIASGRKLRYNQEDISLGGWAIECRILAEDPYEGFLPSIGCITSVHEPSGPGVRVDSGIYEGFELSPYYDSLIGKLITWGETRAEALLRMRRALDEYRIMGIKTNIPFHQQILNSIQFLAGQLDTRFLDEPVPAIEEKPTHLRAAVIATTLLDHRLRQELTKAPVRPDGLGMSNWKRFGRWEGMRQWDIGI